jgi:hypothetical protein
MLRRIAGCLTIALLGWALGASAAPFAVTFSGAIEDDSEVPADLIPGQLFTIRFVLDNGGDSAINQTWNSTHVRCAIFRFNDAQNQEVRIAYFGGGFAVSNTGIFVTSGTGQLTQVPSIWADEGDPIPNQSSNMSAGPALSWYVNASNDVIYFDSTGASVGLSNVGNDTTAAFWTDPVPSTDTCAAAPIQTVEVPTLGEWGLTILSTLLALLAPFALRRAGASRG